MDLAEKRTQLLRGIKLDDCTVTKVSRSYYDNAEIVLGPPVYRVEFELSYGPGSYIRNVLLLPAAWNGILIGLGNGGMAGGFDETRQRTLAQHGYAVVHTDMGTSKGRDEGIGNPDMWKDFGWRATHGSTVVGKQIVRLFYDRDPDYSYFYGASTGGQQSLSEALRFPDDYDGIIASVPGNERTHLHEYFLWCYVKTHTPDGAPLFTPELICEVSAHALEFFRAAGGVTEGCDFIDFPYVGEDTIPRFIRFLEKKMPSLGRDRLAALEAVYRGPSANGKQVYCGMPIGAGAFGQYVLIPGGEPANVYPFLWAFGKNFDPFAFDFGADTGRLDDVLAADLNAVGTDLGAFAARGGKLIMLSGTQDSSVPAPGAMTYYESTVARAGGYDGVAGFFRYFLMPGRNHGSNAPTGTNRLFSADGRRLDLLSSLRLWREKGVAPDRLIAARVEDCDLIFERTIHPYGSPDNPFFPHPASHPID